MRLKTYLAEQRQMKSLTDVEALELIHERCSDSIAVKPIYRGFTAPDKEDCLLIDTGGSFRGSRSDSNLINILVSNFKSWHEFPQRVRSAFFTPDENWARAFAGNFETSDRKSKLVYRAFPVNGTKFGVTPFSDFNFKTQWGSKFLPSPINNDEVYYIAQQIISRHATIHGQIKYENFSKIIEIFKSCDESILSGYTEVPADPNIQKNEFQLHYDGFDLSHILEKIMIEKQIGMVDMIEMLLDPKEAGFKVITVDELNSIQNQEVWMEGEYILVNSTNDILKNLT